MITVLDFKNGHNCASGLIVKSDTPLPEAVDHTLLYPFLQLTNVTFTPMLDADPSVYAMTWIAFKVAPDVSKKYGRRVEPYIEADIRKTVNVSTSAHKFLSDLDDAAAQASTDSIHISFNYFGGDEIQMNIDDAGNKRTQHLSATRLYKHFLISNRVNVGSRAQEDASLPLSFYVTCTSANTDDRFTTLGTRINNRLFDIQNEHDQIHALVACVDIDHAIRKSELEILMVLRDSDTPAMRMNIPQDFLVWLAVHDLVLEPEIQYTDEGKIHGTRLPQYQHVIDAQGSASDLQFKTIYLIESMDELKRGEYTIY